MARAAPPAEAPVFPTPLSTEPVLVHALCVAASLPVRHPSFGSRRGIGVLTPREKPQHPYAWVWVDTLAQSTEELEPYEMMVNSLKRGVQDYSAVCLPSAIAHPQLLDRTVVTFVVEHANQRGSSRVYLVVAGTMAHSKAATVTGTSDDARRLAVQLARESTGEALTWANGSDDAWQRAFTLVDTTWTEPLFGQGGKGLVGNGNVDGAADACVGKPSAGDVTMGTPVVLGSLDPDLITRTVHEHAGQIRTCYESELSRTPGISGRIIMRWVISGEGNVVRAATAETQMNSAKVEACLASSINGWVFPRPKGGGIAIVNYPFTFKPAG